MNIEIDPKDIDLLIRAIETDRARVQEAETTVNLNRDSIVALDAVAEKLKRAREAHAADGSPLRRSPRWELR